MKVIKDFVIIWFKLWSKTFRWGFKCW